MWWVWPHFEQMALTWDLVAAVLWLVMGALAWVVAFDMGRAATGAAEAKLAAADQAAVHVLADLERGPRSARALVKT